MGTITQIMTVGRGDSSTDEINCENLAVHSQIFIDEWQGDCVVISQITCHRDWCSCKLR